MNIFKKMFGSSDSDERGGKPDSQVNPFGRSRPPVPTDPLVVKLISTDDHTFENGLKEATGLVKNGSNSGLSAIRTAIIWLSALPDFKPYQPGFIALSGQDAADYFSADRDLLAMARRREFLKDPNKTQQLIAAFKKMNPGQPGFSKLIDDVYLLGGSGEAHALLLLSNEIWAGQLIASR